MVRKLIILGIVYLSLVFLTACNKSSPTAPESTPTPAPVINYFTADEEIVARGDSSMLDWKTTDATTVSIDNGIGEVYESGIEFVYPEETTTYTLTARNSTGSVTASCTVEVRGAELKIAGTIKKKYWLDMPTFTGFVKNVGDNIAWNAAITIYCYGDAAQTIIIDTAWDYLADGNDIRPGEKVSFEAICFDLESHSQIKSRRIEFDWLEGDIGSLSSSDLQKLHNNQRRAQELRLKKTRAEMEKRGKIY
jgi:hypothetical protein